MEKLRQALKTLSEAEKQLRLSNDKLTWLTAALLQLAPDQQYMLPGSSAEASFNHSPLVSNNAVGRIVRRGIVEHAEMPNYEKGLPTNVRVDTLHTGASVGVYDNGRIQGSIDRKKHAGSGLMHQPSSTFSADANKSKGKQVSGSSCEEIEEIWLQILEKIQINSIRQFMYQEGKLISVNIGAGTS